MTVIFGIVDVLLTLLLGFGMLLIGFKMGRDSVTLEIKKFIVDVSKRMDEKMAKFSLKNTLDSIAPPDPKQALWEIAELGSNKGQMEFILELTKKL